MARILQTMHSSVEARTGVALSPWSDVSVYLLSIELGEGSPGVGDPAGEMGVVEVGGVVMTTGLLGCGCASCWWPPVGDLSELFEPEEARVDLGCGFGRALPLEESECGWKDI